ncbi:MAG TPA: hypothetical protein VJT31_14390 [Rugosimonospora sp.]|nr:hypothetical protein [Rugosimonospora sp.]
MLVVVGAAGVVLPPTSAVALPAALPAPTPLYTEDFEHGQGATPIKLDAYVGAPPADETYTADPQWLSNCNGILTSAQQPATIPSGSGCPDVESWTDLQRMASALGDWAGGSGATNHALGEYTAANPGADHVMFQTVTPVSMSLTHRFITFAVDAAAVNCHVAHPLLAFALLTSNTVIPLEATPIDPCTDPATVLAGVSVGRYTADRAILFTGSSLGLRLTNAQDSGTGNDGAVDNLRIVDVTPRLAWGASPATVPAGGGTTVTLTVTNTAERGRKQGWSLIDTLPTGLTLAHGSGAASTDCTAATLAARPGGNRLALAATLTEDQASCTVTMHVQATAAGRYPLCAPAVLIGLAAPRCTVITFTPVLPATGPPAAGLIGAAVVLLLAGVSFVVLARRGLRGRAESATGTWTTRPRAFRAR